MATNTWTVLTPQSIATTQDLTQSIETERRHAQEVEARDLLIVQNLELKLGILKHWVPADDEWKQTAVMVGKRRYQRCLDSLEGLVVARMFELTKMNMSQTGEWFIIIISIICQNSGYKLHKHIGNALKARSKAVQTALLNYNVAAQALIPPRAPLSWDNIMEYAFLADFDLLSDTHSDVRLKVWAKPASQVLMDQHFKMERAREEIMRLNVEIPRLTTYIHDEEAFLLQHEQSLLQSDPHLSQQLCFHRLKLIRSNDLHIHRIQKLATLSGFCGTIAPGTALDNAAVQQADSHTRATPPVNSEMEEDDEDEIDQETTDTTDALCLVIEGSS